jgi:hypothetical protein
MMLGASIDPKPTESARDERVAVLEEFVAAVTGDNAGRAEAARSVLVEQFGIDWLVDASAVVANFEMMTRLADATGARMRPDQIEAAAPIRAALGLDAFPSARH